jgi:hypothetical protein
MQLIAAIVLAASTPFVGNINAPEPVPTVAPVTSPELETMPEPAAPTAAPAPARPTAPAPTPAVDAQLVASLIKQPALKNAAAPAQSTAAGTGNGVANPALTNLVAEAIKRKLDKAAANNAGGTVDVPSSPANAAAPSTGPMSDPPLAMNMPSISTPDTTMLSGGARVMMGSPSDGSPSYVRVLPSPTPAGAPITKPTPATPPAAAPIANTAKAAPANPLANSTDPMEGGTDTAAAAAEPGVNHNLLDIFVGTWDVSANFDNGPGQPSETANGSMVNSWQLGGRWLKQDYSGTMASLGAFRGLGYLGYDNLAKCYVATWMDTLSTSCLTSRGSFDEAKASFTLTGDFTGPGGEKFKQKQVMTVLSPDRYIVTMYLTGPDGVEFKTGNLEYTRSVRTVTSVTGK